LRYTIDFPPSDDFLVSALYDGAAYVNARGSVEGINDAITQHIIDGNALSGLKKALGVPGREGVSVRGIWDAVSSRHGSIDGFELTMEVRDGTEYVYSSNLGVPGEGEGVSLQIMKVGRYQGFSVMESGLLAKQVTLYADIPALLAFLVGLNTSGRSVQFGHNDFYYLFVFLSPHTQLRLMEGSSDPELYMELKRRVVDEVVDIITHTRLFDELLVYLMVHLNPDIVARDLQEVGVNLFWIHAEGRTFKVHEHLPLGELRPGSGDRETYECLKGLIDASGLDGSLIHRIASYIYRERILGDQQSGYLAARELLDVYKHRKHPDVARRCRGLR
jgi:hypothetical protein